MAPWKAASSTLHASLEQFNESPYPGFFHFNKYLNRVVHQHAILADLMALPEGKLVYNIGAFVRNPYDRAYSGFMQLQRDYRDQPPLEFEKTWIGDLVRAQIATNTARLIGAGFDFDIWMQRLPEHEVLGYGHNTSMVLHPCHYWTHLNGQQVAGFVGRVEQFDADFERFCTYAKIEQPDIHLDNVSEGASFRTGGGSKYASRMSRPTLDRINALFQQDFEYFGYEKV